MSAAPSPRHRGSGGFTLLEVMVALALLALSLMAIADLTGSALRNHAYARELSTATLLARGKMAELEERYEDEGFKDFDETVEGTFEEEGHPEVRWRADLLRPDPNLSSEQLLAAFAGTSGDDASGFLDALLGKGGAKGSDASKTTDAAKGGPTTGASPAGVAAAGGLKTQLTAFGDTLKQSLRELRLTVSWGDGRPARQLAVSTELVVLNPKAPGGSRGDSPDLPPGAASAAAAQQTLQNQMRMLPGASTQGGSSTAPGTGGKSQ